MKPHAISSKMKIGVVTGTVMLLAMASCKTPELPTAVRVDNGPSFVMSGNGHLASFTISAPLDGQTVAESCGTRLVQCSGIASVVWQIEATQGYFKGKSVAGLQIDYGKVPEAYTQNTPNGSRPPPLTSSVIYGFYAETTGAAAAGGSFYVANSGAVQAITPDLCETMKNGRWDRVSCSTGKPYQEPIDLEQFVREHRAAK